MPTALNALGAKGVGESGCSGSLPALGNAMADALRGNGIAPAAPLDMPYTPAARLAGDQVSAAAGLTRADSSTASTFAAGIGLP